MDIELSVHRRLHAISSSDDKIMKWRVEHCDCYGEDFVVFRLCHRANAVVIWAVMLEMIGDDDDDGKPPRRNRSTHKRPNDSISALGMIFTDVKLVDRSSHWMARRFRRLFQVPHHSL